MLPPAPLKAKCTFCFEVGLFPDFCDIGGNVCEGFRTPRRIVLPPTETGINIGGGTPLLEGGNLETTDALFSVAIFGVQ